MKVGLVTYYAVTNVGDRILTDVVTWMLKKNGNDVCIVDLNARYPFRFSGFLGKIEKFVCNIFIRRSSFKDKEKYFERRLKNVDYILFGGGQILEPGRCNTTTNICMITTIAEKYNIPISYNAVGFYKSGVTFVCEELSNALLSHQIQYFSYREHSTNFVNNIFESSNAVLQKVCDTAVWCSEAYNIKRKVRDAIKIVGINIIYAEAFSLTYAVPINDVINEYVKIYKNLTDLGYDCYFFTNGVNKDSITIDKVLKILELDDSKVLKQKHSRNGKDFVTFINNFDFIISSRLHTSICSYSLRIPTIALSWDPKIDDFYGQIGYSQNVFKIGDERLNRIDTVITSAAKMYSDIKRYDDYRNTIINSIPGLL